MILVFHKNNEVVEIFDFENKQKLNKSANNIQHNLLLIASDNNSQFVGWCHYDLKECLNLENWNTILKHKLMLVSFETTASYYISSNIGYVEETPFINVNKTCSYPTWIASSDVGVVHASVLLKFEYLLKYELNFELFLNSMSKVAMKLGVLCYSNPNLLHTKGQNLNLDKHKISTLDFLWFVKSNYKLRWVFLYVMNVLLYKKKLLLVPFLKNLFKEPIKEEASFDDIQLLNEEEIQKPTIDVLIPTLGREHCLKNVLIDLSEQTLLPTKIILVEQIEGVNEKSTLDYLNEDWPFKIEHTLIHQLGACNARNIGLDKVTSDWIFLADDDVRFENDLLENAFNYINLYQAKAIILGCLQKNEKKLQKNITQFVSFSSGASIVNSNYLTNIKFDMAYEFGYGEDVDFGMQLRNIGVDVLYVPFVKMLHLKALIGGFRKKIIKEWEKELIQPKPSPTVMVYKLKHCTKEQLQSYKTTLFFKFYLNQSIKNPISYFKHMNKTWNKSLYWANHLIKKHSNEI